MYIFSKTFSRKIFSSKTTKNFSENIFRNIFRVFLTKNFFRERISGQHGEKIFLVKYFEKSFQEKFFAVLDEKIFRENFAEIVFSKICCFFAIFRENFREKLFFLWIGFRLIKNILKIYKYKFIFIESGY